MTKHIVFQLSFWSQMTKHMAFSAFAIFRMIFEELFLSVKGLIKLITSPLYIREQKRNF